MADYTYTIGISGAYPTIASGAFVAQGQLQQGDTGIFQLLDTSISGGTFINMDKGVNIIISSIHEFDGTSSTGTKILKAPDGTYFLRWLGSNADPSGSTSATTILLKNLVWQASDGGAYVQGLTVQPLRFPHQITVSNCGWFGYLNNYANFAWNDINNEGFNHSLTFDNCVFAGGQARGPSISQTNSGGSSVLSVTYRGCTFYDTYGSFNHTASAASTTVNYIGCLLKPYTTNPEIAITSSVNSLFNASACIFSRAVSSVSAIFSNRVGCDYGVSFVAGTPAAGQVGFSSIVSSNFALVNDANNLAIGFAEGYNMPSVDITDTARPTAYSAGAFDVFVSEIIELVTLKITRLQLT